MKSQRHNEGELSELQVNIEKELLESFFLMSKNAGIPLNDLVAIAMKRFRAAHADYEKSEPSFT